MRRNPIGPQPGLCRLQSTQNSSLIAGNAVAEKIARLKEQPGMNIPVTGNGTLVRFLLREGLLDELQLMVHPIVVGSGKHIFPDGVQQTGLKLANAQTFSTGVLNLTYVPAGA